MSPDVGGGQFGEWPEGVPLVNCESTLIGFAESTRGNVAVWLSLIGTAVAASLPFWPRIANFVASAHISDQLTVSGLILTTGGFGVTVWQLIRTADASRAASAAVDSLRFRLRVAEDSQLCHDCIGLASEIERLHDLVALQPALATFLILPERYRNLRLVLTDLRARRTEFWSNAESRIIQDAVAKLTDAQRTVVRYIGDQSRPLPKIAPLNASVQNLLELLTALSVQLNELHSENGND